MEKTRPKLQALWLLEARVKPGDGAANAVANVFGIYEHMAFVLVDDELRFNIERFEGVPEFVRLRRGTFAVAVPDDHPRWRLALLYECYGRSSALDFVI